MRTSTLIAIVIAGVMGISSIATESKAQRVSVNFSIFQNELGRYGRWMNHPRFGEVWIYNEPGFRPYYSNGQWDYTEYGWEWISDYDWGWAPFHYGRWELDPYYGWIWIPGYEWAPAWVSWSEYGDYYGWAPLGYGLSINISIGSIPYDRWNFCSRPYINQRSFRDYCVPFAQNRNIYRNVTIINNYYGERNGRYAAGPDRREAERYFGRNIETHHYDRDNRYQRRDNDYGRNTPYANNDNRFGNRNEGRNDNSNDNRYNNRNDRNNDNRNDNRFGNNNPGNGRGNGNGNGNGSNNERGYGQQNENGRGNGNSNDGYGNGNRNGNRNENGNSNGNGSNPDYGNRNGGGNGNNGNANRQENRNRNEYEIRNNDRRNRDFNPRNNESERSNQGNNGRRSGRRG